MVHLWLMLDCLLVMKLGVWMVRLLVNLKELKRDDLLLLMVMMLDLWMDNLLDIW